MPPRLDKHKLNTAKKNTCLTYSHFSENAHAFINLTSVICLSLCL